MCEERMPLNHQNIFEDQEDYYQFLKTLDMMALSYEPDGTPGGRNYILYAYYRRILKNKNRENPFSGLTLLSSFYAKCHVFVF